MDREERSLAEEAAARVQAIVAAAETSARQLREDAERDAGEHVERVAAAASELLAKIDAVSAELNGMRTSAAGLRDALEALRADAGSLGRPAAIAKPAPNGARSTDEAGARLVALNMALEGSPRDATARYLEEQFELPDLDALLDDVYASAGR